MRVTCDRKELMDGLNVVGKAISRKSTLPVLQMVAIEPTEEGLQLSGTDLGISIRYRMSAEIEGMSRGLCVPASLLTKFLQRASGKEVTAEINDQTYRMKVHCGRNRATIKGVDLQEFPAIIVQEEGREVEIESDTLRTLLNGTGYATSEDVSRPVLTALHIVFSPEGLTFEAADGYRLTRAKHPLDGIKDHTELLVPGDVVSQLAQVLPKGETVRVVPCKRNGRVQFLMPHIDVVSQLVEGTFPDANQLIPREERFNTKLQVIAPDLLGVCKVALLFTDSLGTNVVRLQFKEGAIRVYTPETTDGQHEAELTATIQGKTDWEVSLNANYLIEALEGLGNARSIHIGIIDPNSPVSIYPMGELDIIHVIMPMHIEEREKVA